MHYTDDETIWRHVLAMDSRFIMWHSNIFFPLNTEWKPISDRGIDLCDYKRVEPLRFYCNEENSLNNNKI